MTNTNEVSWSYLLNEAVNKPGIISSAYSIFHNYSIGNQLLAWSQCIARNIQPSPIATYKKWQELGRQVKKGSKALSLCMPVTIKKNNNISEEKTDDYKQIFVIKRNWFLLNDTDGDDFVFELKHPIWNHKIALQNLDINLTEFTMFNGNCQGYAEGRNIAINPLAYFPIKTMMHEIAHVILGHTYQENMQDSENLAKDIKEVEAESVAYILGSLLKINGLSESRGYIQSWLSNEKISDKSVQRIFGAVEKILKAGNNQIGESK